MRSFYWLFLFFGTSTISIAQAPDNTWVEITKLDSSIKFDIRYATKNNFLKEQVYDCGRCYFKREVAEAFVKAHKKLRTQGYGGLLFFDCYRPTLYQQRLWNKVPNPDYVADPKKGSMHNRGVCADLTVMDKKGKALDMGTEYDAFTERAHTDFLNLSKKVLKNRQVLQNSLTAVGFQTIRTEWWHLSYKNLPNQPLYDWVWDCNSKNK
jgi:D-alanyl-D-alanine dipeptidase